MFSDIDHRKLLENDPPSVDGFLAGLEHLVLRIARGRYRFSRGAAEDVLLEMVRKLWEADKQALRAWRGEGSLKAYMSAMAHRFCLMELRRRRRSMETPVESMDLFQAAAEPDTLEVEERRRLCLKAAAKLSVRDRRLLQMRFLDERDYAAITAELGLSYGAARKALYSAVHRLRDHLRTMAPELFRPLSRSPTGNTRVAGASPHDEETPT